MGYDAAALARILQRPGYRIVGESPPVPEVPRAPVLCAACARPMTTRDDLLKLILPYPPSVNHLYTPLGWGKQVLTQAGRDYHAAVAGAIGPHAQDALTGRLAVTLTMHAPDRRQRDVDGVLKVVLDAMQSAGLYLNDSQIDDLHVRRGAVQHPGHLHITLALL